MAMQIDTLPMISLMSDVVRLRFEDVGVDFPTAAGPMRVVDGVDLEIRQGEFVSIIGPSGCGKTTLLNIVGGFVKPTRGQVLLDHEPVKGPGPDRGVIFQEYGVFPWLTVRGNIEFGLRLRANGRHAGQRAEIVERYLALMGLKDFADHHPKHLSGGMRQRLAIGRILAIDSPVMLMDEPFGALDALTRGLLQADLVALWQETRKTILFITHSVDEALFLAERVVVMTPRPGRIVLDLRIDLPRPRDITTPEFNRYKREIIDVINPVLRLSEPVA
jgi:NitT/TauT family transport system ATP-binding protein